MQDWATRRRAIEDSRYLVSRAGLYGRWRQRAFKVVVTVLDGTLRLTPIYALGRRNALDLRKVDWKVMKEKNLVTLRYKPIDASGWPPAPSGLLGPVRLVPLAHYLPAGAAVAPGGTRRSSVGGPIGDDGLPAWLSNSHQSTR